MANPQDTTAPIDVVIVGGGLVGPALALGLARQGMRSVILDPTPREAARRSDFDGRAYAIALSSRRYLKHIDVWSAIEPEAEDIRQILVTDGRPGERASDHFLRFDSDEMGADGFGHMVEDHTLRLALLDAAEAEPLIEWRDRTSVEDVSASVGGATVTLGGGDSITAPLVIGCDGRRSRVATALGVDLLRAGYDQVGLVCAIRHERPHHGVAHEYFLPNGPFAILPLKDAADGSHRSSLVWSEKSDLAEAMTHVSDAIYLGEVRKRVGGFLGKLELEGKRWVYPLSLQLADHYVGARLALAGDAARGMHPIAGQGFNYGLRDAAALAEVIGAAARRGEDIGALDVLQRYEAWRRPDNVTISVATDGLNRLFSNDIAPIRLARRLGLHAFGQIGPLRRAAMRFAAGDTDGLPATMRP